MVTPYFSSIREALLEAFKGAKSSIDIAIAWFTNEQLFNMVISRLESGVKVRLVMINDDINHCSGLDLQHFIDMGGQLYFGKSGYFMHNKYCIIDGASVYTGSYNYTYFAEHSNFENIVGIDGEKDAIDKFSENFEIILRVSDRATNINTFLKLHPYAINTHASKQVRNVDLSQKVNELLESGHDARAAAVVDELYKQTNELNTFVIRNVIFKNWAQEYCINRIDVTESSIRVYISLYAIDGVCYLYGPGLDKTWHLVTSVGPVYATDITDVRFDDAPILQMAGQNTTYRIVNANSAGSPVPMSYFGKSIDNSEALRQEIIKPDGAKTLTCCISFPKGPYINEIVDIYEGNDNDEGKNCYWHFLRVNMCLNREPLGI